ETGGSAAIEEIGQPRPEGAPGEALTTTPGATAGAAAAPVPRRSRAARAFYSVCWFLSRIAGIILYDVRTFGAHRVPRKGPAVIASNHQSFLDPWILGMCLPRPTYYLARDDLFRFRGFAALIRALNALPIPRRGVSSRRGIELGRGVMRAGEPL